MDGHPQATVVLFPCSLVTQGFKEATMGIILFVCSCSTKRSKRGECCIYRSQPEMSLTWPETEMSCMAGAEKSCMAGAEVSRMPGDSDVLYGRRRSCLVWPETVMSYMAGDDC